jgi:hypothetical protein
MENEMDYAKELYDIIHEFHVPCAAEQEENFLVGYFIYYTLDIINFYENVHVKYLQNACRFGYHSSFQWLIILIYSLCFFLRGFRLL